MPVMKFVILQDQQAIRFVEIPESHAYQLTALHHRLNKEVGKLTAADVPDLPKALAECDGLELTDNSQTIVSALDYINGLETEWSSIQEKSYPIISLLTEIRALQAQLEQWYEEEA